MSESDKGYRTQIIVAIIGLIGVLGAAVVSNWDKLRPSSDDGPSRLPDAHTQSAPVAETSLASKAIIYDDNTARRAGDQTWDWTVFINADQNTLSNVRCVEYTLHPTFPNPIRTVCDDPANHFALSARGWGTFEIKIIFRDGSIQNKVRMLKF
jgi:hypothetical protein